VHNTALPTGKALAPHVVLVQRIAGNLEAATNQDLESVLIQSLRQVFAEDRKLHPYPRLSLARELSKALAEISEEEKAGKLARDIEKNIKGVGFDWERSWMQNTDRSLKAGLDAAGWVNSAANTAGGLKDSGRHLSIDFAEEFLKQKFSGVGCLIQEEGVWRFVHVNKDLVNKELYILNPELTKFEFFGLYPQCVQNIRIVREEKIIPVFALMSGSLLSLEEEYKSRAKQSGCTLEYPSCWPIRTGEGK